MPAPKSLEKYPFEFYQISELASKRSVELTIGKDDQARKDCVRLRQLYYAFRNILQEVQHPHYEFARYIQVRMEQRPDGWTLIFEHASNSVLANALKQAMGDALPPMPAPLILDAPREAISDSSKSKLQPSKDPMESALEKLGYFAGVKKKEGQ